MFNLMNEHKFSIGTGSGDAELARLAAGIISAEPANNEELDQQAYLDSGGFGETDVVGAQMIISFSGHRKYGDAAQDYIYGKMLKLGKDRRTNFEWEEPDGGVFTGDCTIANIEGPGGEGPAKGEISFEIHFNGRPEYTPPTSGAGTQSTETTSK